MKARLALGMAAWFAAAAAAAPIDVAPAGAFHHLDASGRQSLALAGRRVALVWEDSRGGAPRGDVGQPRHALPDHGLQFPAPRLQGALLQLLDQMAVGQGLNRLFQGRKFVRPALVQILAAIGAKQQRIVETALP